MSAVLERCLEEFMRRADYAPRNASELARDLGVPSSERKAMRALLHRWEDEGRVIRLQKGRFSLRDAGRGIKVRGRMRQVTPEKLVFVPSAESREVLRDAFSSNERDEYLVSPARARSAQDGDLVEASILRSLPRGWRKRRKGGYPGLDEVLAEVRVEKIIERKRQTWVGIYRMGGRFGYLSGDGRTAPECIELVQEPPGNLLVGQLAVAEILTQGMERRLPTARVIEVLGWQEDDGVDVIAVMRKYNLESDFSHEVIAEADACHNEISDEERRMRTDWTKRCVITVDPESARDFDDAVSLEELDGEGWLLAVHIADVSHYVTPGSALDREACRRGNSTYLPDRVLPMLPPRLCDHVCSLRANEDHLTLACVMKLDANAVIKSYSFERAIIRSRCRLTYEQAADVMLHGGTVGDADADLLLRRALTLSRLLRRARMEQGALDLDFPELRLNVDEHGHTVGVACEHTDESHAMIEEFMLAANECAARLLREKTIPALFRVHENPDTAKLMTFAQQAREYGLKVGDLTHRQELISLMQAIKGHPDEPLLKVSLLKSMMRARYDTKPLGHYGLAKNDYCHFTSPIRRYADLIVHRALGRTLSNSDKRLTALPDMGHMNEVAEHISETERTSTQAEQEVMNLKLFAWLEEQVKSASPQAWEAIVSDARPMGLMLEIPDLQMRGLLPAEALNQDGWRYESHIPCWGNCSAERLYAGCRFKVVPIRANRETRWIDFGFARED